MRRLSPARRPDASPPRAQSNRATRRPAAREQGSILVLSVVLIVLLVMMGASFLQMARSDRRSTQQMDTRVNDYNDNELAWFNRSVYVPDLPTRTVTVGRDPADGIFTTRFGQIGRDYPFTWSSRPQIQDGDRLTFPVGLEALNGRTPANNPGDIDDPRDSIPPGNGGPLLYEAEGVGPTRSGFVGEIADLLADQGRPPFNAVPDRGQNDDMWLASTEPVFAAWPANPSGLPDTVQDTHNIVTGANGSVQGYWPHISNVRGVFLDLGNVETDGDGSTWPTAYISTADNDLRSGDTWLDLANMQADWELNDGNRFADADGDGIADSRWTYAAATTGGGLTYVAAWRVVDNASMVNLNVASHNAGNSTDAGVAPRWYNPADLSLEASFLQNVLPYASAADRLDALRGLMRDRSGTDGVRGMYATANQDGNTYEERLTSWLLTGKPYRNTASVLPAENPWDEIGSGLQQLAGTTGYDTAAGVLVDPEPFGATADGFADDIGTLGIGGANEVELRFGNGLNRRSDDNQRTYADAPVETRTNEALWRADVDVDEVEINGFREVWHNGTGANPIRPTVQEYVELEPRHRFTTASGSGDFGRFNLNIGLGNPTTADSRFRTQFREFLRGLGDEMDVLAENLAFTGVKNGFDLLEEDRANIQGTGAFDDPTWDGFARLAAAFAVDWRDNDRGDSGNGAQARPELTRSQSGNGPTYYGMEYLPFISEVYLKAKYENDIPGPDVVTGVDFDNNPLTPPTDGHRATYTYADEYYLVVELFNPWDRVIPIAEIQLQLQDINTDTAIAGGTFGTTPSFLRDQIVDEIGRAYMNPHEVIVLRVGGIATGEPLEEIDGEYNFGTGPNDVRHVEIGGGAAPPPPDWPVDATTDQWNLDSDIALALLAPVDGGATTVYQQFAVPPIPDPNGGFIRRYEDDTPNVPVSAATPGQEAVARVSIIGTASGLSALTVRPQELEVQDVFTDLPAGPYLTDVLPAPTRSNGRAINVVIEATATGAPSGDARLGDFAKGRSGTGGGTAFDGRVRDAVQQLATGSDGVPEPTSASPSGDEEPFLIGNAGLFVRASDFFRIVFLGPREVTDPVVDKLTIADVWHETISSPTSDGRYELADFMIDAVPPAGSVSPTNPADMISTEADAPPQIKTTFANFLLSRLTTHGPGQDGIDNDGDGRIDDTDEQLVPGRINLNTIPITNPLVATGAFDDAFRRILPVDDTDAALRQSLALSVLRSRELTGLPVTLGDRRSHRRQRAEDGYGLMSIMDLLDFRLGPPGFDDFGDPASAELITGDFNEYESDISATGTTSGTDFDTDGTTDNLEERLAALGAFHQVFDVRSDIVTVYILLRGYRTGDFANGKIREFRITATVDRSVVHDGRPVPRILSYHRQDLLN